MGNKTGNKSGNKMNEVEELVKKYKDYDYEAEWLEFKEKWFEPDRLGEYISAMSNSAAIAGRKYAYFIWGIADDTHQIVGTKFNPNQDVKGEPLKHYLARKFDPDINIIFKEDLVDGCHMVVLIIPAAKTVPTAFDRDRYIRIGSSTENLRKYPEKEAFLFQVLREGFPTIENTASEYQDLTFEKLFIYYGAKGLRLNTETFEKNLSLRTEEGKYNILAQLLSDNSHIPIRVAIFSGKTKANHLYSVREFGNQCILYSLDEVLRYGDVLNIIQADETNRVVDMKNLAGRMRK